MFTIENEIWKYSHDISVYGEKYLIKNLPCEIENEVETSKNEAIQRAFKRYQQQHDKIKYIKYKQKYLKLKKYI
jgi:hypothetical protein